MINRKHANGHGRKERSVPVVGILLIAIGILFNEWTCAFLFSPDGVINSLTKRIIIWGFDIVVIVTGLLGLSRNIYIYIQK
jgi:hypothetical protein